MTMIPDQHEAERVAHVKKMEVVHAALDEAARACKPCDNLNEILGYRNGVLCMPSVIMDGGQQTMIGFVNTGSCPIACVNRERGTLFMDGKFVPFSLSTDSKAGELPHDDL